AGVELELARSSLENQDDRIALAYCLGNLGRLRQLCRQSGQAIEFLESSLEIHELGGNLHGIGQASEFLARQAIMDSDLEEAERLAGPAQRGGAEQSGPSKKKKRGRCATGRSPVAHRPFQAQSSQSKIVE